MKKGLKVASVLMVVMLVAIMAIGLVACNRQEDYTKKLQKAGYQVVPIEVEDMQADIPTECNWAIYGQKMNEDGTWDYVYIVSYKDKASASEAVQVLSEYLADSHETGGVGNPNNQPKILVFGTNAGYEAATK